jgi:hypothetical protein
MEQIARDHIATIDANLNNIFLPQNFHVYSLRHKNPRQKGRTNILFVTIMQCLMHQT